MLSQYRLIAYDILQVFVHIVIIRSDVRGSVGYHVLGQTDLACDLYGKRATRVSDRSLNKGCIKWRSYNMAPFTIPSVSSAKCFKFW